MVKFVNKGSGVSKEKYAAAFIITTLVFLVGIFVGSEITRGRVESIQHDLQLDVLEAQSLDAELSILQLLGKTEDKCAYIESRIPSIAKKKVEIGRRFDIGNVPKEQADLLGAQFIVSLGRYFILDEMQEKECNSQKPRILLFLDDSEESRQQAKVLDNIVFRLSDVNITVLTFHSMFKDEQEIVRLVYNMNNITKTPAIIVKGVKYEGFQSLERITGILCESYPNDYTKPICT